MPNSKKLASNSQPRQRICMERVWYWTERVVVIIAVTAFYIFSRELSIEAARSACHTFLP